jgi:uncharacterized membrane protein YfcA
MDGGLDLTVFLAASFSSAIVAGLSGFAFGLIATSVWLYVLSPLQSATLIVVFGLIVQGYSVWKLQHAIEWKKLWPFVIGGAFGVPLGVAVLNWADPGRVRVGVGIFLVAYSGWSLLRPSLRPLASRGVALDAVIGFLNGMLAGITGLAGILVTLWCGLRGWTKDQQRAVFQPVGVATFAMIAIWLGGFGLVTPEFATLFAIGLPAVLGGMWLGMRVYGKLDESAFRKVVLVLLLISGATLLF